MTPSLCGSFCSCDTILSVFLEQVISKGSMCEISPYVNLARVTEVSLSCNCKYDAQVDCGKVIKLVSSVHVTLHERLTKTVRLQRFCHHDHPRTCTVTIMLMMLIQNLGVGRHGLLTCMHSVLNCCASVVSSPLLVMIFLTCSLAISKCLPWHPAAILSYSFSSLRQPY